MNKITLPHLALISSLFILSSCGSTVISGNNSVLPSSSTSTNPSVSSTSTIASKVIFDKVLLEGSGYQYDQNSTGNAKLFQYFTNIDNEEFVSLEIAKIQAYTYETGSNTLQIGSGTTNGSLKIHLKYKTSKIVIEARDYFKSYTLSGVVMFNNDKSKVVVNGVSKELEHITGEASTTSTLEYILSEPSDTIVVSNDYVEETTKCRALINSISVTYDK